MDLVSRFFNQLYGSILKITILYSFPSFSRARLNTTVSPVSIMSYAVRTKWKAIVSENNFSHNLQQISLTKISLGYSFGLGVILCMPPQICKGYLRFGEALLSSRAVTLASKLTSVACKPEGKFSYISIFHSFD